MMSKLEVDMDRDSTLTSLPQISWAITRPFGPIDFRSGRKSSVSDKSPGLPQPLRFAELTGVGRSPSASSPTTSKSRFKDDSLRDSTWSAIEASLLEATSTRVGEVTDSPLRDCASLACLATWLCLARSNVFLFLVCLGRPVRLETL